MNKCEQVQTEFELHSLWQAQKRLTVTIILQKKQSLKNPNFCKRVQKGLF